MNHPFDMGKDRKDAESLTELRNELKAIRKELVSLRTELQPELSPVVKQQRRWSMLSLRATFVLLTLLAIYAAGFGAEWRSAQRERQIGEELARQNFSSHWTPTESLVVGALPGRTSEPPEFLVRWFGPELFSDLTSLSLGNSNRRGTREGADAFFDNAEHLGRLKELRLSNLPLKNQDLPAIFQLKQLESLDLSMTGLAEGHMQGIQDLRLRFFDGSHTWIDDEAAKDIAECQSLVYLNLSRTRITDSGLDELRKMPALRHLDLYRTRVSLPGITDFAKAMPHVYIRYEPLIMTDGGRSDRQKSQARGRLFGTVPVYSLPSERPTAPMQSSYGVWGYLGR